MSFSFGNFAMGSPTSPGRFQGGMTRGRIQGGNVQGVNYPSPFFDVAHTYLPTTVKQLFKFCRYYFLTNPLINAIIVKLAEYPVTDVVVDHEDPEVVRRWSEYFNETIRMRSFQIECGLDYQCYGTSAVSLSFPFQKYLTCTSCGFSEQARKIREYWLYTSHEFRLSCPKCGQTGAATPKDWYYRDASSIRPVRWSVEDIEVSYNDITGECTYFYTLPAPIRADVTLGKKDIVEGMPQIFLQAIRQEKGVVFSKANLFVMKRPTLAFQDRGWGIPLILPVLKDAFYLQIMKKAQEALLLEHIVPLRILFPQAASGTTDPFTTINLLDWRDQVAMELARWRQDCVTPESWVEAEAGVVQAGSVKKGDRLRDHTGFLSTVEKVWRRPLRDGERAYQVVVRGLHGAVPCVSEGHPFIARRKFNNGNGHKLGGETKPIRVKDLRVGDYIGYPVPKYPASEASTLDLAEFVDNAVTNDWVYVDYRDAGVPEAYEHLASGAEATDRQALLSEKGWSVNQYKTAQNAIREQRVPRRVTRYIAFDEELCWVSGLYLAEGNVTPKQVLFSLHRDGAEFVARLDAFFLKNFGTEGFTAEKSEQGIQRVYSSTVAAQFFHSLCEGTSVRKRVADELKHAGERRVASLLHGYFDGDGCYHEGHKTEKRDAITASRQLAADVRNLLLAYGFIPGLTRQEPEAYCINGKTGVSSGSYKISLHGGMALRFDAWLRGEPLPHVVHCNIGLFKDGYVWHRIEELREVEAKEVIGFQMTGGPVVTLEDDTETHGTFCLWGMASVNTNYIPIMPLPLGNQTIGGDGKALLMSQEMQMLGEQIMMGMGVPREFLQGGLSWAGSNVSMRMLENTFLSFIGRQRQMVNWIMQLVSHFMGWPKVNVRLKPFKMADDMQRKSYLFQLNQANKISDTTLLADADLDIEDENDIMIRESARRLAAVKKQQLAMAEIQGESQVIMMKMQAKAQQTMQQAQQQPLAPGEPGGPDGALNAQQAQQAAQPPPVPMLPGPAPARGYSSSVPAGAQSSLSIDQDLGSSAGNEKMPVDLVQLATGYAKQIAQLDPDMQEMALNALAAQSQDLADLVTELISKEQQSAAPAGDAVMLGDAQGGSETGGVDMRPLPEALPPRRMQALI